MKVFKIIQKTMILTTLLIMLEVIRPSSLEASIKIDVTKEFDFTNYEFKITGTVDQASFDLSELNFSYHTQSGNLLIGRHKLKIGPGHFSQLLLSDITSLNLLYYEGNYNLLFLPIRGQMLVAFIDPSINKQLLVHRISNNTLIPGLEVGLSESMMVHKKMHPAYYIPVPFWPYYLTSKLLGIYSEFNYYEDKYIGIDFTYKFANRSKLYGELLVDEYPGAPNAQNPHKLAHLIGFNYPVASNQTFRVEYSNVFNYVYVHRFPENVYTNHGKPLGHWLGPDSEVIDFELERVLVNKDILRFGLRHIRKGIGSFEEDYGSDHLEKQFMSEVTKREYMARLGYEKELNDLIVLTIGLELGRSHDQVKDTVTGIGNLDLKAKINF